MNNLPVSFWCYYLTDYEGVKPRQADWDSGKIVKGLKGDTIKGYLELKIGGHWRRYTEENFEEFARTLMTFMGQQLKKFAYAPISIVPIPGSSMSVGARGQFRIVKLAEMLVEGYGDGATVVPAIRWDKPREAAHKRKEYRHPDLYQPHMRLVERPKSPVVLFDDVRTSGSQMIAATRFLLENDVPVIHGVTVACATREQREKVFGWREDSLPIVQTSTDLEWF